MAYDIDSSGQKIDWGDTTILDGLTTISGHAWVNLDVDNADRSVFQKADDNLDNGFMLFFDNVGSGSGRNNIWNIFYDKTNSENVRVEGAQNSGLASAGWQAVGFYLNLGTEAALFVGGTEDANSPVSHTGGSFPNLSSTLRVGLSATSSRDMNGQIAEAALWNRILTDAEFASLGSSPGHSPFFYPRGLIFYAPLIRDPNDRMGLTGTVTGAVAFPHLPMIYPASQYIITPPAAAVGGRIMSSLVGAGGLAGKGGIAGQGGGLAG